MQVFLNDLYLNQTALELSDPSMYSFYQLLRLLRVYILPVVCGLGLLLQIWVILACCQRPIRQSSLQPYLVSLAVSDMVFLAMVMLDWVKAADPNYDFYARQGFCQGMTYISSLCVFISGWYNCCILLDRFLYLYTSPATAKYLCTLLKSKFLCVSILAMGVVVYLNISLLYTVYKWPQQHRCMAILEYKTIVDHFHKVELSLNLGAPYLCITVLLILSAGSHCAQRFSSNYFQGETSKSPVETQVRLQPENCRPVSSRMVNYSNLPNCARLSIATGVVFLILTFPAYVMRVISTVFSEPEHRSKMTLLILLIDRLLQFVFYCRFAVNGLVYFITELTFRKSAKNMLRQLVHCRIFKRNAHHKNNGVSLEDRSTAKEGLLQTANCTSSV